MSLVALWLALLAAPAARAWPVDVAVALTPGQERFHRLTEVDWVEMEDSSIATAELFPETHEMLLTGVKPGRTLLLLYAGGKFAVWRLTVGAPGASATPAPEAGAALAAARKVCPGLTTSEGEERLLTAAVKDTHCREALRAVVKTDAYLARELDLTFELTVLQDQLATLAPVLKPLGLQASYSGAAVVLEGSTSPEGHHQALWELFRQSVGRVPLEDRVEVKSPAPPRDAGTPTPKPSASPVP